MGLRRRMERLGGSQYIPKRRKRGAVLGVVWLLFGCFVSADLDVVRDRPDFKENSKCYY